MECTLKESLACRDHVKVSHPSCKLTFNNLFTKRSHPCSLSPTKALLKEIFSGEVLNTSATVACRLQTMLNKDGNWNLNIWSPNHMSIPESSFLPSVRNTRQSLYCTRQTPHAIVVAMKMVLPSASSRTLGKAFAVCQNALGKIK